MTTSSPWIPLANCEAETGSAASNKHVFPPDPFIIAQLADVRRLKHRLPCHQRGEMCFDFKAGRVRIGAAPC
jgi:hypothetical protein